MSSASSASIARHSFAGARRGSFLRSTSRGAGCGQTLRNGLRRRLYRTPDHQCLYGPARHYTDSWGLRVTARLDKFTAIDATAPPAAMPYGSPALIDRSIAQLESLQAFLADEMQQPWTTTLLPLSERRLCKEALLTISVLLPKLRAVQRAHVSTASRQPPRCTSCDE